MAKTPIQTQVLEKLRTLYEGIRDERGTHANTATRIGNAFLALLSYLAGAPFLRKDQDDSTPHKLTMGAAEVRGDASIKGDAIIGKDGFAGGLAGFGIRLGKDGMMEADGLSLRRFLEVPELRYNRVEVYVGNQWRAPGAGIIESGSRYGRNQAEARGGRDWQGGRGRHLHGNLPRPRGRQQCDGGQ